MTSTSARQPATFSAYPFDMTGIVIVISLLLMTLLFGLMPGLLSGLAAYGCTASLKSTKLMQRWPNKAASMSAAVVILLPILCLVLVGVELGKQIVHAIQNLHELKNHVLQVFVAWAQKLPGGLAELFPTDHAILMDKAQATIKLHGLQIAGVGKTWASSLMLVIVGLVIGALVGATAPNLEAGPLATAMRTRGSFLVQSFRKVVMAQFWIASVNTAFTATLLFVIFPFFDIAIPHSSWLVLLTFVAGMIPIVGNLLCNVALTLAGLGVGVHVAVACLIFLIAVHKFEYFINAKVMGSQIRTSAWELLLVMFAFEAIFGVVGLIAAPLYYAYLKMELAKLNWI